jgi:TolB-like protein/Tfp pilus assembly protein PilF
MTEVSHAVFLSYASQDVEAARKICETLRAAGIEVWFDQSELRGGDAWDQSIRKQIKTCALFLPVISRATHDRVEGYFRLEWKLGVDRSHLISADQAFLLPVVIDDTPDDDERVPERFREVQWTRLPGGVTPAAFVERVRRLLSGEPAQTTGTPPAASRAPAAPATRKPLLALWRSRAALLAAIVVLVTAAGYLAERLVLSKRGAEVAPASVFAPPPHSIAVLPFVNMSGDKEQEYLSDGLTEELLNSLAAINELQVAARTSAFSFKGKDADIGTIARKLNVGAVLEGSVRRSGNTVRITTQLINAVTGFHLWSQTYDRNLGDVLKLETEIAGAVASALKVNLLGDVAAKIEVGGTRDSAAFDAFLRARKANRSGDEQQAIAGLTEAVHLDPTFALAFAWRSLVYSNLGGEEAAMGLTPQQVAQRQEADAREAIKLAPELAEGYAALGRFAEEALDFPQAHEAFERALALAPGSATMLTMNASFLISIGHFDEAISAARHAVTLDPFNGNSHFIVGAALYFARRYQEAVAAFAETISLDPLQRGPYALRGKAYYMLADFESARSSCGHNPGYWASQQCLAMVYNRLGRRTDAEGELAKMKSASPGDGFAYQYAQIYAQWGDRTKALEWLDTAMRLRDGGLETLKTDPLMDPLRKEPRFQAIERELKLPN